MKRFLALLGLLGLVGLLTILTQVGGVILLLCFPLFRWIERRLAKRSRSKRRWAKFGSFLIVYVLISVLIIPPLARLGGRVPLPIMDSPNLRPLTVWTCLFNRHYVRPALRQLLVESAERFEQQYPGSVVAYLDGNHPFWDGYPLIPHLSHKDGKKVDLAFFYEKEGKPVHRRAPTWMGYGSCELPHAGEFNQPVACAEQGSWQYSLLYHLSLRWVGHGLQFDHQRTKAYLRLLAQDGRTGKIFIEPHLKTRLGLSRYGKIRFHGCHAVRHDDHIHLQL